jgi:predicted O-linked N-acetylglucosamine transferase (SPINDLY family)
MSDLLHSSDPDQAAPLIHSFWEIARMNAEAWEHFREGQHASAERLCREILHADPQYPDALHLLGLLSLGRNRGEIAVSLLRRAVDVNPDVAQYHVDLGHALQAQGSVDEALSSYERAYSISPDPGLRVKMAMLLPVIPQSRAEILFWRNRLERQLAEILAEETTELEDPMAQVGVTAFHLAYHGLSDRKLQEAIAIFYLAVCPSLAWTAPHCLPDAPRTYSDGRVRIGFVSTYFRYHTISKVTRGFIERLDRNSFHVTVFRFGTEDEWTSEIDASADHSVTLRGSLADMREAIANEGIDLLYYPDVGMHPTTYFSRICTARTCPVRDLGASRNHGHSSAGLLRFQH